MRRNKRQEDNISKEGAVEAGKTLLQSYVKFRAGETDEANELFEEAVENEDFDAIADGIAVAIQQLQGSEDEDGYFDVEEDDNDDLEDDDLEDDVSASTSKSSRRNKSRRMKAKEDVDDNEEDYVDIEDEGDDLDLDY